MKIYCLKCKDYTHPKHEKDSIVMQCSVCNTKFDFAYSTITGSTNTVTTQVTW
jgi:DNA-directed RNA polymerase subunit M/transcription elongation factor TFIIS